MQTPKAINEDIANSQYSQYEPVPVLNDAPASLVEYLEEHQADYPGVTLQEVTERSYPQNQNSGTDVGTAVLGYVSPISAQELKANPRAGYSQASQVGQSGLESEYEQYLKGKPGQEALSVNAQGTVVGTLSKTAPTQGDTVVTNLDLGLQEYVQGVLQNTITADKQTVDPKTGKYPTANDGAAVVLNAQTGAVLAMATSPTYSLNEWVGGISQANYAALSANCANLVSVTTGCPAVQLRHRRRVHARFDLQAQHRHRRPRRRRDQPGHLRGRHRRLPRAAEVHVGLHLCRRRGVRFRTDRPPRSPHQVGRLLLLQPGRPVLLLQRSRRDTKDGGRVRIG